MTHQPNFPTPPEGDAEVEPTICDCGRTEKVMYDEGGEPVYSFCPVCHPQGYHSGPGRTDEPPAAAPGGLPTEHAFNLAAKLPLFDLAWSDERKDQWFGWVRQLVVAITPAPAAPEPGTPKPTKVGAALLRAMAHNYGDHHIWDHLDKEACQNAAELIDWLEQALAAKAAEVGRMKQAEARCIGILKRTWLKLNCGIDNEPDSKIADSCWGELCNLMGDKQAMLWSDETVPSDD